MCICMAYGLGISVGVFFAVLHLVRNQVSAFATEYNTQNEIQNK
jgi:hypothetical protein